MKEDFLSFAWKNRLYHSKSLHTHAGEALSVRDPGTENRDAGPDYFQAKIRIGETLWAGNVEIHVRASDWKAHGHQHDPAYDNVILHVVYDHDAEVRTHNGRILPTLELRHLIDSSVFSRYQQFLKSQTGIPCQPFLKEIDSLTIRQWLDRLIVQRLERKTAEIDRYLQLHQHDWAEAFYVFLSRNFGFKVNADPFERLARSLPWKVLAKHRDHPEQVEALLYGQAGLLPAEPVDPYSRLLVREYQHLAHKFQLEPLPGSFWRFMRMRPSNFPTIRIAQLASMLHHSDGWFAQLLELKTLDDLRSLFAFPASDYWTNHFQFDRSSPGKVKRLGKSSIDVLLVNTVVPFLFLYGRTKGNNLLEQRAFDLLEHLNSEQNAVVKRWEGYGVKAASALDSQALLELEQNYCLEKNCLFCNIGNRILRSGHD